jgi:hypothetical protein
MSWTIEYYYNEAKKVINMLDSYNKVNSSCSNSIYLDIIKKFNKDNNNSNQINQDNLNLMIREIINELLKNVDIKGSLK